MIDRIELSDVSTFHKEYIIRRKPCILTSIPDDLKCLSQCTDLDLLSRIAGDVKVAVEPISDKGTFGTAETKQEMVFSEFLDQVRAARKVYLTTQYSEEGDDDAVLNEPMITLQNALHIPITPNLAGDLVPAKINIWLGASVEGTSSGLHHDYHDNFYILLAGQKKFRIFEPSWKACQKLSINGTPHEIYRNGLISYSGSLCSDGMTSSMKAQVRLDVCEEVLRNARVSGQCVDDAEARYEEAVETLLASKLENDDEVEDGDFDQEEVHVEVGGVDDDSSHHTETPGNDDKDDELSERNPAFNDEEPAALAEMPEFGKFDDTALSPAPEEGDEGTDPPSFSRLTTGEVSDLLEDVSLKSAQFVLEAGEMLYLPASYFHEVISTSAKGQVHLAVNYWFFPPDAEDGAYLDTEVMNELRDRLDRRYTEHLEPGVIERPSKRLKV